jgi:hypothetical protein
LCLSLVRTEGNTYATNVWALCLSLVRTEGNTYATNVWAVCLSSKRHFTVAPSVRFATFTSLYGAVSSSPTRIHQRLRWHYARSLYPPGAPGRLSSL